MTTATRHVPFFIGLAIIMLIVVVVGFGPSLYLRSVLGTMDRFGPILPPYLLAHGVALTAWYVLFLVQTLLVTVGRRDIHRRLGVIGAALAVAVVASSLITMRRVVVRIGTGGGELPQRLVNVVVSDFWVLVTFTLLVAAAVHFRRRLETHKRLMLLASVFLVGPAFAIGRPIGRTLVPFMPTGLLPSTIFTLLSIGALIFYDVATKKRIAPATLWGIAAIGAAFAATMAMVSSSSGSAFARWLGGLAA